MGLRKLTSISLLIVNLLEALGYALKLPFQGASALKETVAQIFDRWGIGNISGIKKL